VNLKNQIISEIKANGGIGVDRYMELCNTHYYSTRDPLGKQGDFTTSPEISQIFGEMVAVWAITAWEYIGKPEACAVMELGPGRGTLMKDFLRAIKVMPAFKPEIHLVEFSPTLQAAQQSALAGHNVKWHQEIPNLNLPTIVIANEFFDALPIKQYCGKDERMISERDSELYFFADENIREESPVSLDIMKKLSSFAAGLIIDYGYEEPAQGDTFQALKGHKFHNPLQDCGEADLTAHVNFTALQKACSKPSRITTQAEFLLSHGADIRAKILKKEHDLERLTSPLQMGKLFKVLSF
jgi:SAM-dependent MidA family methyltransferase